MLRRIKGLIFNVLLALKTIREGLNFQQLVLSMVNALRDIMSMEKQPRMKSPVWNSVTEIQIANGSRSLLTTSFAIYSVTVVN